MTNTMKPRPIHREKTPRRNEPCPCGSGKKTKKCCLAKIKFLANVPPRYREAVVADRSSAKGFLAGRHAGQSPRVVTRLRPGPTESHI